MKNLLPVKSISKQKIIQTSRLYTAILFVALFFSGCSAKLAPTFDQNIIDNISTSSINIFKLLAEVSPGTKSADFDKRNEAYNNVIGELEALQLQINARPMPKNKTVDKVVAKVNDKLKQNGVGTLITATDTAPSATALKQIEANITKMRDTDKAQGITATEVQVFKGAIVLFLDQATTYESFLNQ